MRSVPEWIAKHDDQKVPPHVRMRIFDAYDGICQLSGRRIRPGDAWDLDHIKAIWKGGAHRESNLWPVLKQPHRVKSATERRDQGHCDRMRQKHLGIYPKSVFKIPSRPFQNKRRDEVSR
jgi:5-methylcytosine-specific restriction enzyme A